MIVMASSSLCPEKARPAFSHNKRPPHNTKNFKWPQNPTVIFCSYIILVVTLLNVGASAMTTKDRIDLRDEARDMFYHAYNAYLENAFPADELMPLSCRGRFRGLEPDRGDIDDALGNFTLTLIDSLDTLVIMGDVDEFERGVKLVIGQTTFDHDIVVSVFETNIRVVGGLLSSHIMAELLRSRMDVMTWYQGELLNMALDVGYRLLPAFNSTTGLPHPRVNLRHGIKPGKVKHIGETCTACAGTMILEFAALSRLSGEPIFEEKASQAMDVLWSSRHRMSNLVGNVLNINTGDWVRRDSGVGAGIDSYYEYVAKAYILLGEEKYLSRWQTHYSAIMKYLGQRTVMQDVHMHRPHSTSKHFVDALGAFWPGLQVLMGDVKPAIESHEVLYQILQRHNFIPEAFTTDFQVHWGQHLLRPEFVESTYFLYRATNDPYYLEAGEKVLRSLQKHARVTCGYASIRDVRTMQQEDRMDSFVLSETFKYLYLLFADETDLIIDINSFVFTTEGHLLPLSLARLSNMTAVPLSEKQAQDAVHDEDVEYALSCPSTDYLFPGNSNYARDLRDSLANVVSDKCPTRKGLRRKLLATDFQSGNPHHLALVKDMGITIISLPDGRVQLLHTFANSKTTEDGEEGLLFMQEMIELSKQQTNLPETPAKLISYVIADQEKVLFAGPAQFGRELVNGFSVTGKVVIGNPIKGCSAATNAQEFWGKIVLVERGDCMFVEKARLLESAGAIGGIVVDNNKGTTASNSPLFSMSGDGTDDVSLPVVFLFSNDAQILYDALDKDPQLSVTIQDSADAEKAKKNGNSNNEKLYDFTSPVSDFLERSKQQVESYFRDTIGLEMQVLATNKIEEIAEPEKSKINRLEEFLNPDNSAIRKLVEHFVLKKPTVLVEILKVPLPELLKLFHHFLAQKAATLEMAYLQLLQVIEEEGAEGVTKRLPPQGDNFIEVNDDGDDDDHSDNFNLSDEEIERILDEYTSSTTTSVEEKSKGKISALIDRLQEEMWLKSQKNVKDEL